MRLWKSIQSVISPGMNSSESILVLRLLSCLCGLAPVVPQFQFAGLGFVGQPRQLVFPLLHSRGSIGLEGARERGGVRPTINVAPKKK